MRFSLLSIGAALGLFAFVSATRAGDPQQRKFTWHHSYQAALAEAKQTGRPIFLEFRCAP